MRFLSALTFLGWLQPRTRSRSRRARHPPRCPPRWQPSSSMSRTTPNLVVVVPSLDALAAGVAAFGKAVGAPDLAEFSARECSCEGLGKGAAGAEHVRALVVSFSRRMMNRWCSRP